MQQIVVSKVIEDLCLYENFNLRELSVLAPGHVYVYQH